MAGALRGLGYDVVPHLAARMVIDRDYGVNRHRGKPAAAFVIVRLAGHDTGTALTISAALPDAVSLGGAGTTAVIAASLSSRRGRR